MFLGVPLGHVVTVAPAILLGGVPRRQRTAVACTTLPPPVSCPPSPPEMLMRPPQALRSLPSPEPLLPTTRPVTRTPSS